MTNQVIEPVWATDKKSLTTELTRADGQTIIGVLVMDGQRVSLHTTYGPVSGPRTTLITRNLASTTEGYKEFLTIATEFLNGGL